MPIRGPRRRCNRRMGRSAQGTAGARSPQCDRSRIAPWHRSPRRVRLHPQRKGQNRRWAHSGEMARSLGDRTRIQSLVPVLPNKDTQEFIAFADASAGQQATALLTVLLNQRGAWLIIDQPEDDVDSKMSQEIVRKMWTAKTRRQFIFTGHNANLVVNGDAELVICCDYIKAGDQTGGQIKAIGAIDSPSSRRKLPRSPKVAAKPLNYGRKSTVFEQPVMFGIGNLMKRVPRAAGRPRWKDAKENRYLVQGRDSLLEVSTESGDRAPSVLPPARKVKPKRITPRVRLCLSTKLVSLIPERWWDTLPIAAILGDMYRVSLSPCEALRRSRPSD